MPDQNKNFFFIHVMKTAGTSFSEILRMNFADHERYPDCCLQKNDDFGRRTESYLSAPAVVRDVNGNRGRVRALSAHVPFATRELLLDDFVTLSLLRHPVDRAVSYLKHCRRDHIEHFEMSLEEIYEHRWFNIPFIQYKT